MQELANAVDDAPRRTVVALGILSSPPETQNVHPHVNCRVFQDMEFEYLATDPAFSGLYGVMTYTSGYAEEETIRWVGRLYRHYCIEGNTDRLGSESYVMAHLVNPDFANGTNGWDIRPAESGSARVKRIEKLGSYQGRFGTDCYGNQALVMRRCAARPNQVGQKIVNLDPGRTYTLRMFSSNLVHMDGGYGNPTFNDIIKLDIQIDDAIVIAGKSFDHHYRSIHTEGLMYWNYHVRRFRPVGSTAWLTITDWASAKERHGNVGRQTAINFIEVQPYLEP